MKRFPNGIAGQAFYQQRSREERPPAGVRIETLPDDLDPIGEPGAKRLIGGSLTTLLYMILKLHHLSLELSSDIAKVMLIDAYRFLIYFLQFQSEI